MHYECSVVESGFCYIPPKSVGGFVSAGHYLGEIHTAKSPSLACGSITVALAVGCSQSARGKSETWAELIMEFGAPILFLSSLDPCLFPMAVVV